MDFRIAQVFRPRFIAITLCLGLAFAALLQAPTAWAQNAKVEQAAKALQKKAMEEDYLATEFGKAQDKLEKAIAQCGTDNKCSPNARATLRRDLGVVQIGGQIDKEKGIQNFVDALKLDPNIQLESDLRTKDLDTAFAEAKKRAASGGGGGGGGAAGGAAANQPISDFRHTPPAAQQERTALPVYAEYTGEETLVRVIVRYKGFGMTEWRTAELKKMGDKGWGGLVGGTEKTCIDILLGVFQYYIQGFDANNDPVAAGGGRNDTYKVNITKEPVAEPPHLPNGTPPTQCKEQAACPPGFPDCMGAKPGGEACNEDKECQSKTCANNVCANVGKDEGEFCDEDSECKSGKCNDSKCTALDTTKKGSRIWVGLFGALDYTFVPSADDVCKLKGDAYPLNDNNYYCVRSDGTDYPYRPTQGDTNPNAGENGRLVESANGGSDKVSGGGALGNIRVMVSVDYAATPNILIGGRIGIVFNNYPGEAAGVDGKRFSIPMHFELRGTYVIGKDALFKKGFAPYVFGAAGAAQFETKVPVSVVEEAGGTGSGGARTPQEVNAWHLSGPVFIAAGGGLRYAITPRAAVMGGLRVNAALGNAFALSVGPELGVQFGF